MKSKFSLLLVLDRYNMILRNFLIVLVLAIVGCKMPVRETTTKALGMNTMLEEVAAEPLFQDLEGNPIALSDFQGKKLVLNYWATWCRPCIEEMPSLMRTQALLKNEGYVFLLPSDQSFKTIKNFVDKKKYDLTFVKYNGSLAEAGIRALPTTFIYNEEGEVVEKIVGGIEWDSPEMIQRLKDIQ